MILRSGGFETTKLAPSAKHQIVVLREACNTLGAGAGDKLLVVVRGDTVVILTRPKSFTKWLSGLE